MQQDFYDSTKFPQLPHAYAYNWSAFNYSASYAGIASSIFMQGVEGWNLVSWRKTRAADIEI